MFFNNVYKIIYLMCQCYLIGHYVLIKILRVFRYFKSFISSTFFYKILLNVKEFGNKCNIVLKFLQTLFISLSSFLIFYYLGYTFNPLYYLIFSISTFCTVIFHFRRLFKFNYAMKSFIRISEMKKVIFRKRKCLI